MKRLLVGILCGMLAIGTFSGCGGAKDDVKQETSTFTWPTSELAKAIPVANISSGEVDINSDTLLVINWYKASLDDYNQYVGQCKDAGYTVDSIEFDNYYHAKSEAGYDLGIDYKEDDKEIRIQLGFTSVDSTSSDNSSSPAEDTISDMENNTDSSTVDQSTDTSTDSIGIRPEVKEFLDSYESFMNEYADFMEKYNNSNDVASMMKDYTTYMTKYADFTQKYEDLGDDDLNDEELKYYVDVQSRVTKRLIDVAN